MASVPRPLRPSFAPSATTATSGRLRSTQSTRRRPPAVVSPLTPAFTTRYGYPSRLSRASTSAGHASSAATPSPAVRLSPSATTTRSPLPADATGVLRRPSKSAMPAARRHTMRTV